MTNSTRKANAEAEQLSELWANNLMRWGGGFIIIGCVVFMLAVGYNMSMPELFGLPTLNFQEVFGFVVLAATLGNALEEYIRHLKGL